MSTVQSIRKHNTNSNGEPGCGGEMLFLFTTVNPTASEHYCPKCHDSIRLNEKELTYVREEARKIREKF